MPEGDGRRGYHPGKVRRGTGQLAPQVHGQAALMVMAGEVGRGGALYIPGFSLTILSGFSYACLLFGIYVLGAAL